MAVIETQGFKLDNSGKRIVVDPITRIEGHLRIEVNVDDKNVIRNAVSTGTMWRGLEVILKGRDPRDAWAFVERICGVCTGVHALASVRAVEDALKIKIPDNANIIRNLMHATLYAQDHLVHFYHLHALDWVDVVSALKADPKSTSELAQSISSWPMSSPGYFRDLQSRLKKFVDSGQLGPFRNGYWGHPAYKLPPEANLMAVAHYLEALDFQKEIVKIQTIFGGKNPHPNWLVGGVPCSINLEATGAVGAINMERLNMVSKIIDDTIAFIDNVYIPDLLAIASFYKDWGAIGGGLSSQNLLAYGEFPDIANDDSNKSLLMPRGAIVNGKLDEIQPVDLKDPAQIQEFVGHSWYKYADETKGLHPFDGVTEPNFALGAGTKGTKTAIDVGRRKRQVLVGQVAALARQCDGSRAAGALRGRLRDGQARVQGAGGHGAEEARRAAAGAVLDARPHRGARPGVFVGGAQDALLLRQADGQSEGRQLRHRQRRQLGAQDLAGHGAGRGLLRGAARRARPLDQDQGHQDRQLPVRGADDLERGPARRARTRSAPTRRR